MAEESFDEMLLIEDKVDRKMKKKKEKEEVVKMKMKMKRKRKMKEEEEGGSRFDVGSSIPWTDANPKDPAALLMGSDQGGFMCLEEAEGEFWSNLDSSVVDPSVLTSQQVPTTSVHSKAKKRKPKRKAEGETERDEDGRKKSKRAIEKQHADDNNSYVAREAQGSSSQSGHIFDQSTETCNTECELPGWAKLRLHWRINKALAKLNFSEPTPIQRACIAAAAHQGKDVIGAAETGSGKTLAFVIPILQRILEEEEKYNVSKSNGSMDDQSLRKGSKDGSSLRALIVTPTRELSLQVCDHFRAAASYTRVAVCPIVGGMSTQKQERLLKQRPHVIVGTPGRLWELMSAGEKHLVELRSLSFFVLDEADRMVEKGHFKELQSIMGMLPVDNRKQCVKSLYHRDEVMDTPDVIHEPSATGIPIEQFVKRRQTFVFSATLALPAGFKKKLKRGYFQGTHELKKDDFSVATLSQRAGVRPNAAIVDLTSEKIVVDKLVESSIHCREEEKDKMLYYIVKMHGHGRMIVFCTSIAAVRRVGALLQLLQVQAWSLHAQMQQRQRLKAMDRFRDNENSVLVATDVAARGLDIHDVRTVIHYQLPHSAEVYVHRSGRTARASKEGCSIVLISPSEKLKFSSLCRTLGKMDGLPAFPVNEAYMPAILRRIHMAQKIDTLLRKDAQTKAKNSWFRRHAEALGVDVDDIESDGNADHHSLGKVTMENKGSLQHKRLLQSFKDMLQQPLEPTSFSHRFITGAGISPVMAGQLVDFTQQKMLKNQTRSTKKAKKTEMARRGLVVIGQQMVEPLAMLRSSNQR